MLIWGSSSGNLKYKYMMEGTCTVCQHKEFVLHGIQHYGHLWWIPVFPTRKIFFLTCLNCESTISNNKLENLIGDAVQKSNFKTPLWSFSFLIILVPIILLVFFGPSNENSRIDQPKTFEIKDNVSAIKEHDFLILHDKKQFGYLIARVLRIEREQITFQISKLLYKKKWKLDSVVRRDSKVFKEDFYLDDYYETSIEELKKEFELKEIISRTDHS